VEGTAGFVVIEGPDVVEPLIEVLLRLGAGGLDGVAGVADAPDDWDGAGVVVVGHLHGGLG